MQAIKQAVSGNWERENQPQEIMFLIETWPDNIVKYKVEYL